MYLKMYLCNIAVYQAMNYNFYESYLSSVFSLTLSDLKPITSFTSWNDWGYSLH